MTQGDESNYTDPRDGSFKAVEGRQSWTRNNIRKSQSQHIKLGPGGVALRESELEPVPEVEDGDEVATTPIKEVQLLQ